MAIPGRLEAAFGADRTADPESYTWTDLTALTQQNDVAITRGAGSSDTQVPAAAMTVALGNNGDLTPRKATSAYYPHVALGLPVRHSVDTGARYLGLTGAAGSRASTPDAATLDITSDISGAVQFRSPVRLPPAGLVLKVAAKWGAVGQRSYRLQLTEGGNALWRWSNDGTAELSALTSMPVPRPDAGPLTIAWELDVSIGGNNVTTWYVGAVTLAELLADLTAYQFGDPWTNTGTTSIFASTAVLDLGDNTGSTFPAYVGGIDRFQLRSGNLTSGTIVANPDFTGQTAGAGSFADSTGKTWTINAPAAITARKTRMVGELAANSPTWPGHGVSGTAQVTWQVAGPLRRMRQGAKPLESTLRRLITSTSVSSLVHAYWPLEDGSDATLLDSPIAGVAPMRIRGSFSLASDATFASSLPLLNIGAGENAYMAAPIPATIAQVAGVKWEVTRFFRINDPAVNPSATQLMAVDTNGRVATWRISINDVGVFISGRDSDDASVVSTNFASDTRFFDTWAMIVLEVTDNGVNVDWAVTLIPIPLGVGFGTTGTFVGNTGVPRAIRNSMTGPPSGISTGHVIVSAGASIGWLAPADSAFVGEPAPQRVFRLCRENGIPVAVDGPYGTDWDAAVAAGAQPMGPQRALPVVTLLEECAAVDSGILSESRDLLGFAYRAGVTRYNPTPALTLTNEVVQPFAPTDDDQGLVNDTTVTRPSGSSAHRTTDPAPAPGELYEQSREVNVLSDGDVGNHASWWLHEATWPELRYPDLTFDLAKNTSLLDDWFGTNFGDVIEATALPSTHPTTSLAQTLEGYTETLSPLDWQVKANGRPSGPWEVGIRDDDDRGKRDTAGSSLAAGINTVATSLSVATAVGPLWTTDGGEVPFDLDIGGEQVTATAVSGASSPQTFTVTRSVNGVVKSHSSGEAVRLWRPTIRAF